jgi:hypothetical protein
MWSSSLRNIKGNSPCTHWQQSDLFSFYWVPVGSRRHVASEEVVTPSDDCVLLSGDIVLLCATVDTQKDREVAHKNLYGCHIQGALFP